MFDGESHMMTMEAAVLLWVAVALLWLIALFEVAPIIMRAPGYVLGPVTFVITYAVGTMPAAWPHSSLWLALVYAPFIVIVWDVVKKFSFPRIRWPFDH